MMMQRIWLTLAMLVLFFSLPSVPAKTYGAEQFNQVITVQHDGSFLVRETIVFVFNGGPFTFVYRDLPEEKTDGIVVQSASMDGQALDTGTGNGQVEIDSGNPVKVTWHFAPLADEAHTFVLTYRVLGVVQQTPQADLLAWEVLPTRYDYPVLSSTTTVRYPAQAALLGVPRVTRGIAHIAASPGVVTFTARDISAGSPLEITLNFRAGSLIRQAPHWQQSQDQEQALLFPFLAAGLALFLVLVLLALWHYRRFFLPAFPVEAGVSPAPPDELSPALVGTLLAPASTPGWNSALATIFDLADRGVLTISQVSGSQRRSLRRPDFQIVQLEQPAQMRASEHGLLSALFDDREGRRSSLALSRLSRNYANRRQRFTRQLVQELVQAGLLDSLRRRTRAWLLGISLGVISVALTAVVIAVNIAGLRPVAFLPLGVALAGGVACTLWLACSPLTAEGQQEKARWRAFSRYLADITRGRMPVLDPAMFRTYLTYAASCGLAERWVKYFQRQGIEDVPPWFRSLARVPAENMDFFVVMTTAFRVAGTSSGGASSGGAAGGGASGAG